VLDHFTKKKRLELLLLNFLQVILSGTVICLALQTSELAIWNNVILFHQGVKEISHFVASIALYRDGWHF